MVGYNQEREWIYWSRTSKNYWKNQWNKKLFICEDEYNSQTFRTTNKRKGEKPKLWKIEIKRSTSQQTIQGIIGRYLKIQYLNFIFF